MVAHRCQSKKNKKQKTKKQKNKKKNENKKPKKWKNYYSEKNPTKLSWPMSAKSDKFFIQKEKKTQNYHGPWVPNLILSYQALYITK